MCKDNESKEQTFAELVEDNFNQCLMDLFYGIGNLIICFLLRMFIRKERTDGNSGPEKTNY